MANTYVLISTVTVGSGGASTIDFTSIPATYTDLKLVCSLRNSGANNWAGLIFNGSAASFTMKNIKAYATTATSQSVTDYIYVAQQNMSTDTSNTFSSVEVYIPNYTSSSNKSFSIYGVREGNSATNNDLFLWSARYTSSSAITSMQLTSNGSGTFVQNSTAYLYGIKNS